MRDQTKPLPQLREGDKVLVRRVDTWVEAEVARCANGQRQAKAKAESDLARETRRQQMHYARKFGTAADAVGCGGDDGDDDSKNKDNNDDYNNYYSYSSRSSTAYPGEHWPDKYRTLSNPHSAWDRGGRSTGGGSGQYAYALYKGKQYTMAEIEGMLAADRKRAPKTDPLREQIRALRRELLTFHVVPDPADDLDQFMFEEAYAASDFSSAGGDDDRGWGAEDDIADGWSQGGRQSGHSVSEARERAPRRERRPRRAAWGMDEWAVPAADEADGHPSEEPTAGHDDAHSAREVDDDHHHYHHHDSRASSTPAAAAASDWANPYDLQFDSAAAGGSVSLSAFGSFPTSASASLSLAAFGPTSGGSVSYGMPETTTLAAGVHLHDASRFFTSATTTATIHAFDDNYCAPTYSDSIDFAAAASADHDYNSRYTTADTYGYNNDDDNSSADNNNSGSSHHYGNESGEDNDNGAEEEEGDFGGLFSENTERRESRSSASPAAVTTATRKGSGKSKANEAAAATANSGAGGEGGKAGVIDLRQTKRRQKWEARQVKREEFKRRQRQERKLGAAN